MWGFHYLRFQKQVLSIWGNRAGAWGTLTKGSDAYKSDAWSKAIYCLLKSWRCAYNCMSVAWYWCLKILRCNLPKYALNLRRETCSLALILLSKGISICQSFRGEAEKKPELLFLQIVPPWNAGSALVFLSSSEHNPSTGELKFCPSPILTAPLGPVLLGQCLFFTDFGECDR